LSDKINVIIQTVEKAGRVGGLGEFIVSAIALACAAVYMTGYQIGDLLLHIFVIGVQIIVVGWLVATLVILIFVIIRRLLISSQKSNKR